MTLEEISELNSTRDKENEISHDSAKKEINKNLNELPETLQIANKIAELEKTALAITHEVIDENGNVIKSEVIKG